MDAHDFDMCDLVQPVEDLFEPPRRENQRVAAGEDHFPNFVMRGDIAEGAASSAAGVKCVAPPGPTISRRKQKRQ